MNLLLTFIIAVIVGLIGYYVSLAVPFLASFAALVGLILFLLVLVGGYGGWTFPRR